MRRRRYAKSKRVFKILHKRTQLRLGRSIASAPEAAIVKSSTVKTPTQQKISSSLALRAAVLSRRADARTPSREVLRFLPRVGRKKARKEFFVKSALATIRRTLRWNTPALSRISEVRHLAAVKRATPRKVQGL